MPFRIRMAELTTVDVYEIASDIGTEFQHLIELYGREKLTVVMTMVLKALEYLEDQTIKLENENTEINNLHFTIERLQDERKMKSDERIKFEKECELIDDSWRSELKIKIDKIQKLEDDNRKLLLSISHVDKTLEQKVTTEQSPMLVEIRLLREEVGVLRGQWRDTVKRADTLAFDCEMLEKDKRYLEGQIEELRKRLREMEDRVQGLMVERDGKMGKGREKDAEIRVWKKRVSALEKELDAEQRDITIMLLQEQLDKLHFKLNQMEGERSSSLTSGTVNDFDITDADDNDNEDDDDAVQGPINKEPEEKLNPDMFVKKSKIRAFFNRLLKPSPLKTSNYSSYYSQQPKRQSEKYYNDSEKYHSKMYSQHDKKIKITFKKSEKPNQQYFEKDKTIQQKSPSETSHNSSFSHSTKINLNLSSSQSSEIYPSLHASNFHRSHPSTSSNHKIHSKKFNNSFHHNPSHPNASVSNHDSYSNTSDSPTDQLILHISQMDDPSHLNDPFALHALLTNPGPNLENQPSKSHTSS